MARMARAMRALVLAGGLTALMTAPAQAALQVSSDGTVATLTETTGAKDNLRVQPYECWVDSEPASCVKFSTLGTPIVAQSDWCAVPESDPDAVYCVVTERVVASLGAGDDFVEHQIGNIPITLDGGPGEDYLEGGDAADRIIGGPDDDQLRGLLGDDELLGDAGDDVLTGHEGDDDLYGGADADLLLGEADADLLRGEDGADRLQGGPGADDLDGADGDDVLESPTSDISGADDSAGKDILRGGPGTDLAVYAARSENLTLSIGTGADDGASGEGDDIGADVEHLKGGHGSDTMIGTAGPNEFDGGQGADRLEGRDGADVLQGNNDDDTILGEGGDDTLRGAGGSDSITGGPGLDKMEADTLGCQNLCSNGNDTVDARDGVQEQVSCGGGSDRLIADELDIAPLDSGQLCEVVERPAGSGGGTNTGGGGTTPGGTTPGGTPPGATSLLSDLLAPRPTRRKGVRLTFTLARAALVTATLERRVGSRWRRVARVSRRLEAGARSVAIKRVRGKKLPKGRFRAKVDAQDAAGETGREVVAFRITR